MTCWSPAPRATRWACGSCPGRSPPTNSPAAHPLPDLLPLGAELERVFLAQVHRQPPDTQTMLLLAAAEQTGDVRVVLAAAQLSGIAADALDGPSAPRLSASTETG